MFAVECLALYSLSVIVLLQVKFVKHQLGVGYLAVEQVVAYKFVKSILAVCEIVGRLVSVPCSSLVDKIVYGIYAILSIDLLKIFILFCTQPINNLEL